MFFTVIITFYGLPLNIIRDVYITARSFVTRLRALHRYKTATKNMDQRYPNATEEEMMTMTDRTCIICREEMILNQVPATQPADGPNTTPKKLPCGHIFHFHCLRSWLERQQSCPTWYVPCLLKGPQCDSHVHQAAAQFLTTLRWFQHHHYLEFHLRTTLMLWITTHPSIDRFQVILL